MRKVLVLYAHPFTGHSKANKAMRAAISKVEGVHIHDLYETYPNFVIHAEREKSLLQRHDTIVFQHPIYWYNIPSLVKEWLDRVLEHGWAYGAGGHALEGKELLCAVTSGGSEHAYSQVGQNLFELSSLLRPYELTAKLCGMRYLKPFIVYGAPALSDEAVKHYAGQYGDLLKAYTEDFTSDAPNTLHEIHRPFSTHHDVNESELAP